MKIINALAIKSIKMKAIILAACFFSASILHAQDSCFNNAIIKTSSIGTGEDSIAFSLQFAVAKDSVIIEYGAEAASNVVFKVISRTCHWNNNFKTGESIYNVEAMPERKKAVLKIIVIDTRRVIELIYGNTEPRIFNIASFLL